MHEYDGSDKNFRFFLLQLALSMAPPHCELYFCKRQQQEKNGKEGKRQFFITGIIVQERRGGGGKFPT